MQDIQDMLESGLMTERGGTWMSTEDGCSGHLVLIPLAESLHLSIFYYGNNYPSWSIGLSHKTKDELVRSIRKSYPGWHVHKNHLSIPVEGDSEVKDLF